MRRSPTKNRTIRLDREELGREELDQPALFAGQASPDGTCGGTTCGVNSMTTAETEESQVFLEFGSSTLFDSDGFRVDDPWRPCKHTGDLSEAVSRSQVAHS